MLEVKDLSVAYGKHPALDGVSLRVAPGEIVVILGANGAGKSTLLRAISGVCEGAVRGEVALDGAPLTGLTPDHIVERGVALVPEGRGVFADLTVRENLVLGAYSDRARREESANLTRVLGLFPKLREREKQVVRTMSGGEQQMVAVGRAMMSAPQILMLDEPSLGLSPLLCKELFQNLAQVKDLGIGVLLVEQNAKQSLAIADRGYLLENTSIVHEDQAARLASDPAVQKAYLGAGSNSVPGGKPAPKSDAAPLAPAPVVARQTPRRSAEEQIGTSIDALVETATSTSARAPRGTAPETSAAAHRLAQDRLAVVLKDIETAAAAARKSRTAPRRETAPAPAVPSTPATPEAPPVIEVYRKPRVEVYRRRPSGQFERD